MWFIDNKNTRLNNKSSALATNETDCCNQTRAKNEIQIGYVIEPYRSHQKLKVRLNLELEPATSLGSTPCRPGQDGGLFSLLCLVCSSTQLQQMIFYWYLMSVEMCNCLINKFYPISFQNWGRLRQLRLLNPTLIRERTDRAGIRLKDESALHGPPTTTCWVSCCFCANRDCI